MISTSVAANTCPVCKSAVDESKVIPIYARGREELDPRRKTPKRPAGQWTPGNRGFSPFSFMRFEMRFGTIPRLFGVENMEGMGEGEVHGFISRLFLMMATLVLVSIILY